MYQMLIVDDEPIVRDGIRQLLPWEEFGLEICAEGTDGRDGLRKVLEFQPQLVLVDIKMPGMSGMDLIREAREQGFKGEFIILTGYSEFEYAKTAISLGVKGYLLKPIDEIELREMVEQIIQQLNKKSEKEQYYKVSELKAKREVLRRILSHRLDVATMAKEVTLYKIGFHEKCYCVVIAKFTEKMLNEEIVLENYIAEEKVNALLNGIDNVETLIEDDKAIIIFKGKTYQEAVKLLKANNNRLRLREGDGFFLAFGHTVANWKDLVFSCDCARLLLEYEFLYEQEGIATIEIFENTEQGYVENFVEKLGNLIEVGDKDGIRKALEAYESHFKVRLLQESEVKMLTAQNLILLHNNLSKRYEQIKTSFPSLDMITKLLLKASSIEQMKENVIEFSIRLSDTIGNTTSENVVKRMLSYMEKNYDKDLKLESIAKMFNYNSAYLGKVFKKEVGESFNVTLDRIRIENAKKLLIENDMKVYQVSEKVGFSNIDYFCSKFKKYVGASPKEYKKEKYNNC